MLSVLDNTLAVAFKAMSGNRFGILNPKKLLKDVEKINGELNVKTPSMKTEIQNLSGGNQQKVLICRWLLGLTLALSMKYIELCVNLQKKENPLLWCPLKCLNYLVYRTGSW